MIDGYHEMAREVVRSYLRSAVIIDDEWPGEPSAAEERADEIDESHLVTESEAEEPHRPDRGGLAVVETPVPPPWEGVAASKDGPAPGVDPCLRRIRDEVVRRGLLACGFRYEGPRSRETAIRLARRADIVLLDWQLGEGDGGEEAIEILRQMRKRGSLAFVFVFTRAARPREVRALLAQALGGGEDVPGAADGDDFRFGNLIFVVRNKPGTTFSGDRPDLARVVAEERVLDEAIDGIARVHSGLLQLAMLEMTAKHREQLPEILGVCDPSLDPMLLAETRLPESPVGRPRGAFLGALIDEWRSRLERGASELRVLGEEGLRHRRKRLAGRLPETDAECLRAALVGAGLPEQRVGAFLRVPEAERERLLATWVESGLPDPPPSAKGSHWKKKEFDRAAKALLYALAGDSNRQPSWEQAYLRLDAFFHEQTDAPTIVTQGTVLRVLADDASGHAASSGNDEKPAYYLICTTPACDAERPAGQDHVYTFVPAVRASLNHALGGKLSAEPGCANLSPRPFYCVVHDGDEPTLLVAFEKRPVSLRIRNESIGEDRPVAAELYAGESDGSPGAARPGLSLAVVAQLRFEMALRLAAEATRHASRVGVSRLELLRKCVEGS